MDTEAILERRRLRRRASFWRVAAFVILAVAVLALVGVINVPIIYFSVQWWNTLHQGATIRLIGKPTIAAPMLTAMLIMLAACWFYSVAVVLIRLRCIILEREQNAARFAEVNA